MLIYSFDRGRSGDDHALHRRQHDSGTGSSEHRTPVTHAFARDHGLGVSALASGPSGRRAELQLRSSAPIVACVVLYLGTNVELKVRGIDGLDRTVIKKANCTINLFAPPKNPKLNPGDRTCPDVVVNAEYDPPSGYYIAHVPTSGRPWCPGQWWMQGVLSGGEKDYYAFDFESFTLH